MRFESLFENYEMAQELIGDCKDKMATDQSALQSVGFTPATGRFLNAVLKDIEENEGSSKALLDKFKQHVLDEFTREKAEQELAQRDCSVAPSSASSEDAKEDAKDEIQNDKKSKQVAALRAVLKEAFPGDMSLGERYIVINENIYINRVLVDAKKKIHRTAYRIEFMRTRLSKRLAEGVQSISSDSNKEFEFSNPMRFYRDLSAKKDPVVGGELNDVFMHQT